MADDFGRDVSKFISNLTRNLSTKAKDAVAEVAARTGVELIRKRTRQGFGVASNYNSKYKLKPLSASYIEYRKTINLSSETSPSKSNLTKTGTMLDSLDAKRTRPGAWSIYLYGQNSSGKSNAEIARYVSRARPFMFLSGGEIEEIKKAASKKLRELVKTKF